MPSSPHPPLLIHLSPPTSHLPLLPLLFPSSSPKVLKLNLSEQQQDQLFALCDCDCSGTISEEEFVRG